MVGRLRPLSFTAEERELIAMVPDTTKVRNHLLRYGSITDAEAREYYGISRLSAVIYKLRHKEHPYMDIQTVMYYDETDRWGQPSQYGRYFLKSVEDIES